MTAISDKLRNILSLTRCYATRLFHLGRLLPFHNIEPAAYK